MNTGRTETLADDAAGFRKPLHFRCISCDKPLGLKSAELVIMAVTNISPISVTVLIIIHVVVSTCCIAHCIEHNSLT